jgi:dihydrolipoamide dehydrogenase
MSFSAKISDNRDESNSPCLFGKSLPKEPFDVIIIGGGPGGYVAAIRAAQLGLKTALVEGKHLGGVCLNWGCIPTKALLKSASMLASASHMKSFGLTLPPGDIIIDLDVMVQRSRQLASTLQSGIKGLLAKNGVSVFSAWASFESISAGLNKGPIPPHGLQSTADLLALSNPATGSLGQNAEKDSGAGACPTNVHFDTPRSSALHTVRLTNQDKETGHLFGKNIVIATGARARTLFPDDLGIWSAPQAMTPEKRPTSILIIGAGAIGIEFASFYRTLGTDVTVVEQSDTILPIEDAEIVAIAAKSFIKQGMILETGCTVNHVVKNQDESYTATIKNLKTGGGRPVVDDVGGGSRPAAGGTQATAPLPYPRYVLRDLLKTAASRAPCARRELLASLLFAPAWGLGCMAERGPSAAGERCWLARDAC